MVKCLFDSVGGLSLPPLDHVLWLLGYHGIPLAKLLAHMTLSPWPVPCHILLGTKMGNTQSYLKVLAKVKDKYSKIIIHSGVNNTWLCQLKGTKMSVGSEFKFAKKMSDFFFFVPCPIWPVMTLLAAYNIQQLLSRLCSENDIVYTGNW